ncbi:MAG: precorrin-6y C5,15-methyltransferase (decarboxylating) subunit CbiE [Oscillatoriales cyanobacterium]|nr:MAG: precorrin-6y C5,15-methyltransferase (decarboxylating) subunit CbiE [Oscillatoriales cyanobacterium]
MTQPLNGSVGNPAAPAPAPVQVVGIGLDGVTGLGDRLRALVDRASLLVGSSRQLALFPHSPAETVVLGDLDDVVAVIRAHLATEGDRPPLVVVLASGDPLFFGIGRFLLEKLPAHWLDFHPHTSSVQLAFARVKLPWQDAVIFSAHGRSLEGLARLLRQGVEKVAILTDGVSHPGAIAQLVLNLRLPTRYRLWVCENLGGPTEQTRSWILDEATATDLAQEPIAPLNVAVLERIPNPSGIDRAALPCLGIADGDFYGFPDRPGLMTKREVRVQVLAELALQPAQVVWDIGAGTGSVSIELARLCPESQIYAIEQTAVGLGAIERNIDRFQTPNVVAIKGKAPDVLRPLPAPDRVFIGGSDGRLAAILDWCSGHLAPGGRIVAALATLENQAMLLDWLANQSVWRARWLQLQIAQSVPIGSMLRWSPLNPVILVTISPR